MKANQYLITGASSDIGRALIRYLENDVANRILAVSRSAFDPGTATVDKNHQYLTQIDFTKPDDLETLRLHAYEFFDQPFTVVHSVGKFWFHKPLTETPLDEALEMIHSHYFTLFGVAHAILPVQQEVGGGRLIAFSCNSVGYNYPDMAAFTSAKAAVECLIKCIANEYSQFGISANAIALSTILTDKVQQSKQPKYFKDYVTVEELAQLVLETIAELSSLVNGNVVKLLKYSEYFYNEGYYQRNPPV